MNAILEEHYEGEASMNMPVPSKKLKTSNKAIKYKCSKCEFCTSDIERFKNHEVSGHAEPKLTNENFIFPKFVGFNCILRGSSYMEAPYFITEVKQLQQNNHDNLSETCYFFIPSEIIKLHLYLVNSEKVKIPFSRMSSHCSNLLISIFHSGETLTFADKFISFWNSFDDSVLLIN